MYVVINEGLNLSKLIKINAYLEEDSTKAIQYAGTNQQFFLVKPPVNRYNFLNNPANLNDPQ